MALRISFPFPASGRETQNGSQMEEIQGWVTQNAASLMGRRHGHPTVVDWGFSHSVSLVKLGNILLWSCYLPPKHSERQRHQHGLPSQRDSLIQLVCDRQKSQITENVIWKLKNGDMLNEKLSIYFCNIDFFISLKKCSFWRLFFSSRAKKKKHSI